MALSSFSRRALPGAVLLWLGWTALCARPAWGFEVTDLPPQLSAARPRFEVGASSRVDGEHSSAILAFRVPYAELGFRQVGDRFEAEFDLTMVLSRGKRQIAGDLWHEKVSVDTEEQTRSRESAYEKIVVLEAEPGELRAEASIQERRTGRGSGVEWTLVMPDYERESLSISTLWPTRCRSDFASDPILPPREWQLETRFGEPLDSLCVVGEIYRKTGTSPLKLRWRILDSRKDRRSSGELTVEGGARAPFSIPLELKDLWLGAYSFEVEVKDDGKEAVRRFLFEMDETMVSLARDQEQSLELLRLIATESEIDSLSTLAEGEREAGWNRFWKTHDPTPGTLDNEFRDEFFERVRHANQQFGVLEPGWKSDRGRIYIRFGPPDEIEARPSTEDGLSFEVWTYLQQRRQFVFVDYDGFGRYELYQPGRS